MRWSYSTYETRGSQVIIIIKAATCGMICDQRAELIEVVGGYIRVKLCGTHEIILVSPDETCGVEFNQNLSVKYQVTQTKRSSYDLRNPTR